MVVFEPWAFLERWLLRAQEAGQPPQAVGDPGGESPGAASAAPAAVPTAPVTPEVVLGRLAEAVAQLASASSGPPGGGGQWKESKWIKSPEAFNAKSLDEEVSLWPDWSSDLRISWRFRTTTTGATLRKPKLQRCGFPLKIIVRLCEHVL